MSIFRWPSPEGPIPKMKRRAKSRKKARDKRPGMSEKHLANIRKLCCSLCMESAPSQVHHLKRDTGERGMQLRATDKWGIPLCLTCHDYVERLGTRNEPTWFKQLAESLWGNRHSLAAMQLVFISNKEVWK